MMKMSEILKYLGDSVNDEIVRLLSPCKRMTSSNITCIVTLQALNNQVYMFAPSTLCTARLC